MKILNCFKKYPLCVSLTTLTIVEFFTFCFFKRMVVEPNVIAICLSGVAVIGGYFITHYLELLRRDDERKYNRYSEFLKSLRFLINEKELMGTDQQKELRDNLQHASFQAALLIEKNTYQKFKAMMVQCGKFMQAKDSPQKTIEVKKFQAKQSEFVNALRRDYRSLSEIDFETWDFYLQ